MAFNPKHDPASLFYQTLSDVISGKKQVLSKILLCVLCGSVVKSF
jgi:hypothetical protein